MTNPTNYTLREQAKAIVGAVLAGLAALGTALADGVISPVEWVGIGIAFVATYGTVFGVSNGGTGQRNERGEVDLEREIFAAPTSFRPLAMRKPPPHQNDRGQTDVVTILAIVALLAIILVLVGVLPVD